MFNHFSKPKKIYLVLILVLMGFSACTTTDLEPLTTDISPGIEISLPASVPPTPEPAIPTDILKPTSIPPTSVPPTTVPPTSIPPTAVSPTSVPITFDNICSQVGQTIELEGILHLPDEISCTTGGKPDWCTAQLLDADRDAYMTIGLNIEPGVYDPIDNFMADLPMLYDLSDFRVRTNAGKLVGDGDLVRIRGNVTSPLLGSTSGQEVNCSLDSIDNIEQVDHITIQGPEPLTQTNLVEAVSNGWVITSITGAGLSNMDISLQPQVDYSLEVSLELGTLFIAQSGGVQNMILRQGTVVILKPGSEVSLELNVSCANMELTEPSGEDYFVIGQGEINTDLIKLLNHLDFRFASGRVQQFAIWTITDNPLRDAYIGITDQYGLGSGPTDEEMQSIYNLFDSAGIDTSKYLAFNT